MRIRKKISFAISVVIILTILIFAGILMNMEKKNVIQQNCQEQEMYLNFYIMEFEDILDNTAGLNRDTDRSTLESYTISAIRTKQTTGFMKDLVQFRSIKYALYDEVSGRYWFNNTDFDLQEVQPSQKEMQQMILTNEEKHYVVSSKLLSREDFSVYTLEDISDSYTYLYQMAGIIGATGVALCIVTVLVIYLVIGRLLSSLKLLEKHVKSISTGEYGDVIEIHSKDEMENLADCFNEMTVKLEQTMEEKEQEIENREMLIHALSHELKTPLTSVKGCAQTLRLRKLPEEQQEELLTMMDKECGRLEKLSNKMMQLLIVKSMDTTSFQDCDLNQMLRNVKNSIEKVYPTKNLTITIETDCRIIHGDEDLLFELLSNLVDNAAKACGQNGRIQISVLKNVLTVEDDGIGIKPENLKNVMLPFFMEDKSRSRKNNGVGLGLAICAKIVELHHMRLEVESSQEQGTRIRIYNLFTK